MSVGEQVAILYCGTKGLMKDIAVSQVSEFQTRFLQQMRAAHQQDVLDVLSSGVINDDVTAIITEVAQQVSMTLKK
jgi:F-type H+-transporting ATPase subunit alpha